MPFAYNVLALPDGDATHSDVRSRVTLCERVDSARNGSGLGNGHERLGCLLEREPTDPAFLQDDREGVAVVGATPAPQ